MNEELKVYEYVYLVALENQTYPRPTQGFILAHNLQEAHDKVYADFVNARTDLPWERRYVSVREFGFATKLENG